MSDRSTITAAFGGKIRTFRIDMGGWDLFQAEHDVGPFFLEMSYRAMRGTPAQIKDIIQFGLIGGGMDEDEAVNLVTSVVKAGYLTRYYQLSHNILLAFIGPDDDEDAPPKKTPPPMEGATKSEAEDSSQSDE